MFQLKVSIKQQRLIVLQNSVIVKAYSVSTAAKGVGEYFGSGQTPRGQHIIRAKIGKDCSVNTVFVGRRPTGEIYTPLLSQQYPDRDWILTRILWLSGLEIGKNRLNNVDTMRRYIYIHGSPDEILIPKAFRVATSLQQSRSLKGEGYMKTPGSHGCIRMRNEDVMELFDMIPVGTNIDINEI